ncbi:MAG: TVP38/TMEM64 family protein [Gammaproteobacteria bacterium]|nr:TVP38/TMEM64 family protein [Gammaproteobacteria bacterium]MDH3768402.1 TVP38/TMEM64 family protein [Gammaproteobacteria bacterium]
MLHTAPTGGILIREVERIKKTTITRLLIVALLIAAILMLRLLPVSQWLTGMEAWVQAHPIAGCFVYLGLTVTAIVALTPGWIPMMLAGLLFGLVPGVLYGLLGITIGATAAMLVGRTLARSWVEQRISGNEQLLALDDALDEQAFTIVALTRIALVIPFNMLNYAYGLTRVPVLIYASATAIGMLPVVALYAYLGSLARDIGEILSREADVGTSVWWLGGITLIVMTIIVFVVRRTVQRNLEQRVRRNRRADQTKP